MAKTLRIPSKPSESEVKAHELTHMPARSWCKWCMLGKMREDQHRRQKQIDEDQTGKVPLLALDYCFLWETSEDNEKKHPVLVIVCRKSGNIGAVKCEQKGAGDLYAVGYVVNFVGVLGWSEVVLRCDPEASTMQIVRKCRR